MNDKQTRHVFISYVHENSEQIQRLYDELTNHGVKVWLDRNDIKPGSRWKDAIREAIRSGDFFIACLSKESSSRTKSYMNEEITLAVEELRQYPTDRAWFIPILLSECDVPSRGIGGGETLRDIQWIELYTDWTAGIKKLLSVMKVSSISGLWNSNYGSVRLVQDGPNIHGEYSYDIPPYHSIYLYDGILSGIISGKYIIFRWRDRGVMGQMGGMGGGYWEINENELRGALFPHGEKLNISDFAENPEELIKLGREDHKRWILHKKISAHTKLFSDIRKGFYDAAII